MIRQIADRHGLVVIEDSCESPGSEYKGIKCGNGAYAHGAVFAFYPNKQITTGEGGMVVTDDPEIARLCRSMANQGRGEAGVWLSHERLGFIAPEVTRMSWFVYVIRVGTEEPRPERQSEIRNHVMEVLQKNEVGWRRDMFGMKTRVVWGNSMPQGITAWLLSTRRSMPTGRMTSALAHRYLATTTVLVRSYQ